ncbi:MAG: Csu type fimbrial protein [Rhodoferax sp.]
MKHLLRQRTTALLGLALVGLLLYAAPAHAAGSITCSSTSMTALSFASVNPLASQTASTATLSYTCKNSDSAARSAMLCFSIGEPGGAQTSPRLMHKGTNTLQFQLYQDAGYSTVWGSQFFGSFLTPLQVKITLGAGATTNRSATLYGQVLVNQTPAIPGSYTDAYADGDTALTINDVSGSSPPSSCGSTSTNQYFPFTVSATVTKQCTVTAGAASNINLGSVPSSQTNTSGNNSISVSCSNTTPYYIGLSPNSTASTTGAGTMSGTLGGNTDKVPYQLFSNAGLSTAWGNTATSTSVGNGVSGTGTGSAQSIPVYAKAPSANYTPDSYSDTVTVNVNY